MRALTCIGAISGVLFALWAGTDEAGRALNGMLRAADGTAKRYLGLELRLSSYGHLNKESIGRKPQPT